MTKPYASSIYVRVETKPRSIRLPVDMLERGEALKKKTGVPVHEQIRRAYAAYLEKELESATS